MANKARRKRAADSDEEAFEPSDSESDGTGEDSDSDSDFEASDGDVLIVGASGPLPWVCQHCTYRNDVDSKTNSTVCEVCEAPRDDASDDDFEEQEQLTPKPPPPHRNRESPIRKCTLVRPDRERLSPVRWKNYVKILWK